MILAPEIFREIWGEISRAFRNVAKLAIFLSFHKERFHISKLKNLKVVILGEKIFQSIKNSPVNQVFQKKITLSLS